MKYLVQTWSQAKSSGIKLPEVHGIGKELDPNVHPEKQVLKSIAATKVKEMSQVKPRLGQRREDLRCKIKTPMLNSISKPIMQVREKQPNVLVPDTRRIQDKIVPIPNYTTPHTWSKDDSGSSMVERKVTQDVSREIPICPDPVYRPLPKPVKTPIPEIPGSLSDIDPELNTDFEKNSPFQEGVISEMYQRLDNTYFQEPQELESLISTGRLVQKYLPKQGDINKLLKIMQRKVLKGTYLPVIVKEI